MSGTWAVGGSRPVWKATLFGVPLVLCSCGVIPVTASFRRHGASRAAATSFLLSTPQTGIDSIAITYALLGPVVAVFRPIIAFVTGLVWRHVSYGFSAQPKLAARTAKAGPIAIEACCTGNGRQNIVLPRALEYGFVVLPRDIGGALLLGILIAGIISGLVPQHGWEALSRRRNPVDHRHDGLGVPIVRLCVGVGADCSRADSCGRIARARVGLPDFRPGQQSSHHYHGLETIGTRTDRALSIGGRHRARSAGACCSIGLCPPFTPSCPLWPPTCMK